MTYTNMALEIAQRLKNENKITIKELGILRRAILTNPYKEKETSHEGSC